MRKHLAPPLLYYDPMVKEKIVERQVFCLDEFLMQTDFIIIMVGHKEIIDHSDCMKNKIILDTRKCVCGEIYRL